MALLAAVQLLSAIFAVAASLLWMGASLIKKVLMQLYVDDEVSGIGGGIQDLLDAVDLQSKWNARAAICASLAALLQAAVLLPDIFGA